jgi:hypothetical protein
MPPPPKGAPAADLNNWLEITNQEIIIDIEESNYSGPRRDQDVGVATTPRSGVGTILFRQP